jgi:hypothetical protein
MADRAGLVNAAGRENDAAFRQVLQRCSTEIAALARGIRNLVYDVLPSTVEVVWPTQRSVGWGIGPKKFSEQFAYFMPYARNVTLGFYHGGDLSDPERLLPDTGGRQAGGALSMRSMKITTGQQIAQPALRALIEAAAADKTARRGPTA